MHRFFHFRTFLFFQTVAFPDIFYWYYVQYANASLPSESSPASLSSGFYISLLPSTYTYRNAGSNGHDPLSCPSYIIQRIHNISMVFVYPLPLAKSSCDNIAIISSIRSLLYCKGNVSILQYLFSTSGSVITASFNTRLYSI